MTINFKKTNFLSINADDQSPFAIRGMTIYPTNKYIYLGSPITGGSISDQIQEHLHEKKKHSRKFSSFLAKNADAPFHVKRLIWDAALMSSLLYGCESWFSKNLNKVEAEYMLTLKQLLGVRLQTCHDLCRAEIDAPMAQSLVISRQQTFLKKVRKSDHFEDSPLSNAMQLASRCKSPMDRYLQWLDSYKTDPTEDCKQKTTSNIQDSSSSKRIFYKSINPTLTPHSVYTKPSPIKTYTPERLRLAFTRLRVSSHNLKVETGRWARLPRESRLCPCGSGDVQDEFHAICQCRFTSNIRSMFPHIVFTSIKEFFASKHTRDISKICEMVLKALDN